MAESIVKTVEQQADRPWYESGWGTLGTGIGSFLGGAFGKNALSKLIALAPTAGPWAALAAAAGASAYGSKEIWESELAKDKRDAYKKAANRLELANALAVTPDIMSDEDALEQLTANDSSFNKDLRIKELEAQLLAAQAGKPVPESKIVPTPTMKNEDPDYSPYAATSLEDLNKILLR